MGTPVCSRCCCCRCCVELLLLLFAGFNKCLVGFVFSLKVFSNLPDYQNGIGRFPQITSRGLVTSNKDLLPHFQPPLLSCRTRLSLD